MLLRTTALCGVVFSFSIASALAQELPRFDVKAHCKVIANFGGSYSAITERGCFQMEQASYDSLKGPWASLPERMKTHCIEIAKFGGTGNYMTLEGCVKLELEATQANEGSEFKF